MHVCGGRRSAAGAAVDVDGLWNDVGLNIPKSLHAGGSLCLRDGAQLLQTVEKVRKTRGLAASCSLHWRLLICQVDVECARPPPTAAAVNVCRLERARCGAVLVRRPFTRLAERGVRAEGIVCRLKMHCKTATIPKIMR